MADRYLKVLLTVVALELLWLAAYGMPGAASAQGATPVVITGVRLETPDESVLPVVVKGMVTFQALGPVKVEADRPLPVQGVPYTPGKRPGE